MISIEQALSSALRAQTGSEGWAWFEDARARIPSGGPEALLDAYARAPFHVGRGPLSLTDEGVRDLQASAPEIGFDRWSRDDAARAVLLLARRQSGAQARTIVEDTTACFDRGDAGEQQSWLRALPLWPEAEGFLASAIDACRTNIVPVFEAIACENPYPVRYFPELNFNQMILKALFNSIALSRVVGLASRLNVELSRMARDYAAERTAAGRTVPPDIGLAIHDLEHSAR